jgi:GTPase SAR1 family protein
MNTAKPHEEENKENKYKITFIGMSGSGKTSIINRLINNSFSDLYNPTLEKT